MTTAPEWQSAVGDVWAAEWAQTDRSFAGLSPHLDAAIRAAAPAGTGGAVDLGCGAGQTSIALAAARPDLSVAGVDISPELIRIATERGAEQDNLRFSVADLSVDAREVAVGADLLFSRHGVMFFDRPDDVFAQLHEAVAPSARLVFSCFRSAGENAWASALMAAVGVAAPPPAGYAPSPFAFADRTFVTGLLHDAGWRNASAVPVDYAYIAGEGTDPVADAVSFFQRVGPSAAAFRGIVGPARDAIAARLAAALERYADGESVKIPAAAWIWTADA